MFGLFPPNSKLTSFKLLFAAFSMIFLPTSVLPVNDNFSIFMCEDIASPTVGPRPVRMLITPGGKPASVMSEARRRAVRGVNSEGLKTIVFPHARAGPSFQHINITVIYQRVVNVDLIHISQNSVETAQRKRVRGKFQATI